MSTIKDTLWYDENSNSLIIIDQTRLPSSFVTRSITTPEELYESIYTLAVRGAPAIGVAAAIGLAVIASRLTTDNFYKSITEIAEYINSSRPTAVNLSWALRRMISKINPSLSAADCIAILYNEAFAIRDEDIQTCKQIGINGAALIKDGGSYMTHCNAGRLAAVRYGTALAPFYIAHENGKNIHVYADETRPLLQGARLTAYELEQAGIPVTVQCDSMAASLMSAGKINGVFVGCDRCAVNGDFANKIGTYSLAIIARQFGVPFYVCLPSSTIDKNAKSGKDIAIEQRSGKEISEMWYTAPMTPAGISYFNPAFDVTPNAFVTSFITEKGIFAPGKLEC